MLSIEIKAEAEPEPDTEPSGVLLQKPTTEAFTQATKPKADSEISDTIQKRLLEGRIVVKLPARELPPSEDNSDSSQACNRWSWLRKALSRS